MAQISLTINIPDAKAAEIQDTLCRAYNYQGEGTKTAWIKASIIRNVKNDYKEQLIQDARDAANAAIEAANSEANSTDFN